MRVVESGSLDDVDSIFRLKRPMMTFISFSRCLRTSLLICDCDKVVELDINAATALRIPLPDAIDSANTVNTQDKRTVTNESENLFENR